MYPKIYAYKFWVTYFALNYLLYKLLVVPGPPVNVSVIGRTATQLKVSWLPPEDLNGILKGYYVYNGKLVIQTPVLILY